MIIGQKEGLHHRLTFGQRLFLNNYKRHFRVVCQPNDIGQLASVWKRVCIIAKRLEKGCYWSMIIGIFMKDYQPVSILRLSLCKCSTITNCFNWDVDQLLVIDGFVNSPSSSVYQLHYHSPSMNATKVGDDHGSLFGRLQTAKNAG